jgi:hypothetical protein
MTPEGMTNSAAAAVVFPVPGDEPLDAQINIIKCFCNNTIKGASDQTKRDDLLSAIKKLEQIAENLLIAGDYLKASIANFFLGSIKISSVIFPILLTFWFIKQKYESLNLRSWLYLAGLNLISVLGILGYFIYPQIYQKGYQIYFKAQAEWGRGHFSFLTDYIGVQEEFYFERISEIIVFIMLIYIFAKAYKKIDSEIYAFSLYHFLLPVLTGTLLSLNRLSLYCFPVLLFMFSKLASNRMAYYITLIIFIAWQLAGLYTFINGNFVG